MCSWTLLVIMTVVVLVDMVTAPLLVLASICGVLLVTVGVGITDVVLVITKPVHVSKFNITKSKRLSYFTNCFH